MTKSERRKANLILLAVVFLVIFAITAMITLGKPYVDAKGVCGTKGVFDFSQADFNKSNQFYLQGEWEFYYNTLLMSDDIQTAPEADFLEVPGAWNNSVFSNNHYPAGGYASYRGYLENVTAENSVSIYVPNLAGAYRVYVNGDLISSSGAFGQDTVRVQSTTAANKRPIALKADETYEVIIEVAFEDFSGLYLSPLLIDHTYDNYYTSAMIGLRYLLIGIVFFCGVLFTVIRSASKPHIYSFWLPLLSLLLCLRMLISTEGYGISQSLFLFTSYERMNLFIFVSTFVIKLAALMYLKESLKFTISDNTLVLFCAVFLSIAVGTGFLPSSVYNTYIFALLQSFSFLIDLYIFNQLSLCMAKKVPNAPIYTLAYMFVSVGIMVDALYTNGLIPFKCSTYMPVCFFVFVISIAVIHAKEITALYFEATQKRQMEDELEDAHMLIMLSQIQPHFLYNALNTIKALIRRNPKTAENAIIDFSYYLRGNMDSLSKKEPIPFSVELEHIQHYCSIELLRFSDKINIVYDIGPRAFLVPTLSVQPLVENAIKHGITKKTEGGTVTLSTGEDDKNYYIRVTDDGVGFDTAHVQKNDEKSHVGIEITKKRFQTMVNAVLHIESTPANGTTVLVTLPKKDNKK